MSNHATITTLFNVTPGRTVLMTEGAYSDYHTLGVFRVVKAMDRDQVIAMIRLNDAELPEHDRGKISDGDEDWHVNADALLNMLVRNGFIEEVDCDEIHLGDYDAPDWLFKKED